MKKIFLLISLTLTFLNASDVLNKIDEFEATKQENENGAVFLQRKFSIELDEKNFSKFKIYYLIAILDNQAALDYSHLHSSFNSYYKNAKLDFARVITKSGEIHKIKRDAVHIKDVNDNMYSDSKIIEFSLPNLKAGTFIEYQITFSDIKQLIPNHFSLRGNLVKIHESIASKLRIDPIRESILELKTPKEQKINYQINVLEDEVDITENDDSKVYKWKYTNIKSFTLERLSSLRYEDKIPSFEISTMDDWNIVNNYLFTVLNSRIDTSHDLKQLAKDLVKGLSSDKEKIHAIYEYMHKNIKYIFANLNMGGYTPHYASEIYRNQYGDCKDQTILFISLLKAVGIKANPVLINSRGLDDISIERVVSPYYYDHMITYIPSEDIWVDTVGDNDIYPGISNRLLNKTSFILSKKEAKLKKIDVDIKNEIDIVQNYSIEDDIIINNMDIELKGSFSQYYKSFYTRNNKELDKNFRRTLNGYFPNSTIEKLEFYNYDSLVKNFVIKATIKMVNLFDKNSKGNILNYNGDITNFPLSFTYFSYMTKEKEQGFNFTAPFHIKSTIHCAAPIENTKPILKTIPQVFDTDFFKTTFEQKQTNTDIIIISTLEVKKPRILPSEYKKAFKEKEEIFKKSYWYLSYDYNPFYKNIAKLLDTDDLNSKIKLADEFVNIMELEKAKETLVNIVDLYPNNYDINYLYGVILGLIGEDDESSRYLQIAETIQTGE